MDLLFRKNFIGDAQVYESQLYDAQAGYPLVKSVGEQSQHNELTYIENMLLFPMVMLIVIYNVQYIPQKYFKRGF